MNIIETNIKFKEPLRDRTSTDFVIVHHAKAKKCTVNDIHNWHIKRGWIGFGYNYFIDKKGFVYCGRPEKKSDADAFGYNDNSISICLEGNFEAEKIQEIQKNALVELLVDIRTRYPNLKIMRHKDVNDTLCPGSIPWIDILAKVMNKERDTKEHEELKKYVTFEEFEKMHNMFNDNLKKLDLEIEKMKEFLSKELNIRIR